jgi:hypothetical protein
MAYNGLKPAVTDGKVSLLTGIRDNFARLATLFQGGGGSDSTIPTNAKRIDNDGKMYYWNGTAWVAISTVSDSAYGSDWNGVADVAPSKNAVYDKIELLTTAISTNAVDGTKGVVSPIPGSATPTSISILASKKLNMFMNRAGGTSSANIIINATDDTYVAIVDGTATSGTLSGSFVKICDNGSTIRVESRKNGSAYEFHNQDGSSTSAAYMWY